MPEYDKEGRRFIHIFGTRMPEMTFFGRAFFFLEIVNVDVIVVVVIVDVDVIVVAVAVDVIVVALVLAVDVMVVVVGSVIASC